MIASKNLKNIKYLQLQITFDFIINPYNFTIFLKHYDY